MIVTREIDYALRIVRSLADKQKCTMKDLCAEQDIPRQFAYKIIKKLASAQIIKSTRGVNGGCVLVKDLDKFTLFDLINAVDSKKYLSACADPDFRCEYNDGHNGSCTFHYNLCEIQKTFDESLKRYTMKDMLSLPKNGQIK